MKLAPHVASQNQPAFAYDWPLYVIWIKEPRESQESYAIYLWGVAKDCGCQSIDIEVGGPVYVINVCLVNDTRAAP